MRLLHTSDWHLADRLKHVDRMGDLHRAVERVADYCRQESVDVLVVAGDLFSDLARPDTFQLSVAHLSQVFRPFLLNGGTIVGVTGNHDNEVYCQTLRRAFQLAAPLTAREGELLAGGRLYLALRPTCFCLADRNGQPVQFTCMPYPRSGVYLDAPADSSGGATYTNLEEKRRLLGRAFASRLQRIRKLLRPDLPQVLVAHITVQGTDVPELFRVSEREDIVVDDRDLGRGWDYVALGHLHRPQARCGPNVRYSGSIERLDIGERDHNKGVVLVELDVRKRITKPVMLPLQSTPFYDVRIRNPRRDLAELESRYPHAARTLVRCHVEFKPAEDNLPEILAQLTRTFPRCYQRSWTALRNSQSDSGQSHELQPTSLSGAPPGLRSAVDHEGLLDDIAGDSLEVRLAHYLKGVLDGDPDRNELLALARQLFAEVLHSATPRTDRETELEES